MGNRISRHAFYNVKRLLAAVTTVAASPGPPPPGSVAWLLAASAPLFFHQGRPQERTTGPGCEKSQAKELRQLFHDAGLRYMLFFASLDTHSAWRKRRSRPRS